jgi:hypothetical protein
LGVALGTLIGAVCGLAWTCLLTVRRTAEISSGRRMFISEGIFRPFLCTLPLVIFSVFMRGHALTFNTAALLGLSGFASYVLLYRFGRLFRGSLQFGKPCLQVR